MVPDLEPRLSYALPHMYYNSLMCAIHTQNLCIYAYAYTHILELIHVCPHTWKPYTYICTYIYIYMCNIYICVSIYTTSMCTNTQKIEKELGIGTCPAHDFISENLHKSWRPKFAWDCGESSDSQSHRPTLQWLRDEHLTIDSRVLLFYKHFTHEADLVSTKKNVCFSRKSNGSELWVPLFKALQLSLSYAPNQLGQKIFELLSKHDTIRASNLHVNIFHRTEMLPRNYGLRRRWLDREIHWYGTWASGYMGLLRSLYIMSTHCKRQWRV